MLSKQNLKPDTIKLLSFNVKGLSNFKKKEEQYFPGAESKKLI